MKNTVEIEVYILKNDLFIEGIFTAQKGEEVKVKNDFISGEILHICVNRKSLRIHKNQLHIFVEKKTKTKYLPINF